MKLVKRKKNKSIILDEWKEFCWKHLIYLKCLAGECYLISLRHNSYSQIISGKLNIEPIRFFLLKYKTRNHQNRV